MSELENRFIKDNFISSVFVHSPRTGGTVIRRIFNHINNGEDNHLTFEESINKFGREHFYYGIVRDPIERLLSLFFSESYLNKYIIPIFGKKISFNDFVLNLDYIENILRKKGDFHSILPQYDMLTYNDDEVDYIIRNENLKKDFTELLNKIKKESVNPFTIEEINTLIPDKNKSINTVVSFFSNNSKTHYVNNNLTNGSYYPDDRSDIEYFNEQSLNYFKDYYKKDFEYFGYKI